VYGTVNYIVVCMLVLSAFAIDILTLKSVGTRFGKAVVLNLELRLISL
jgi:hypothetical protein